MASLIADTTHLQETDSAHVRLSRSCPPDSHFRNNSAFYECKLAHHWDDRTTLNPV